jgi:lambda family phage portal protein
MRHAARRNWDPILGGKHFGYWLTSNGSADQEVLKRLIIERNRSRDLERTNPYAVKYFTLLVANLIGDEGIRLVPRVVDLVVGKDGKWHPVPDRLANDTIRKAWERWGRYGECTIDAISTWSGVQALLAISWKRDGEVFLRKYRGGRFGEFGFRVQPFESDHCPVNLSRDLQSGNSIRMGIEKNGEGRVVAYWLTRNHPGDTGSQSLDRYERIPSDEIIHLYTAKRVGQSRGLPSLEAGITTMEMLGGYEQAELVAARAGASKMGFITSAEGSGGFDDDESLELTENEQIEHLDPGSIGKLAEGEGFEGFDPSHPNTALPDFVKHMIRKFSGTTESGYNSNSNDLEGVSFSSLRSAKLEERDQWKREQGHFIAVVCEQVYSDWLSLALLGNAIPLPASRIEKFSAHRWQARRWEWIDPLKEAAANTNELENMTTSLSRIAADKGREVREVFEEIAAEIDLAAEFGVAHLLPYGTKPKNAPMAAPPPAVED